MAQLVGPLRHSLHAAYENIADRQPSRSSIGRRDTDFEGRLCSPCSHLRGGLGKHQEYRNWLILFSCSLFETLGLPGNRVPPSPPILFHSISCAADGQCAGSAIRRRACNCLAKMFPMRSSFLMIRRPPTSTLTWIKFPKIW